MTAERIHFILACVHFLCDGYSVNTPESGLSYRGKGNDYHDSFTTQHTLPFLITDNTVLSSSVNARLTAEMTFSNNKLVNKLFIPNSIPAINNWQLPNLESFTKHNDPFDPTVSSIYSMPVHRIQSSSNECGTLRIVNKPVYREKRTIAFPPTKINPKTEYHNGILEGSSLKAAGNATSPGVVLQTYLKRMMAQQQGGMPRLSAITPNIGRMTPDAYADIMSDITDMMAQTGGMYYNPMLMQGIMQSMQQMNPHSNAHSSPLANTAAIQPVKHNMAVKVTSQSNIGSVAPIQVQPPNIAPSRQPIDIPDYLKPTLNIFQRPQPILQYNPEIINLPASRKPAPPGFHSPHRQTIDIPDYLKPIMQYSPMLNHMQPPLPNHSNTNSYMLSRAKNLQNFINRPQSRVQAQSPYINEQALSNSGREAGTILNHTSNFERDQWNSESGVPQIYSSQSTPKSTESVDAVINDFKTSIAKLSTIKGSFNLDPFLQSVLRFGLSNPQMNLQEIANKLRADSPKNSNLVQSISTVGSSDSINYNPASTYGLRPSNKDLKEFNAFRKFQMIPQNTKMSPFYKPLVVKRTENVFQKTSLGVINYTYKSHLETGPSKWHLLDPTFSNCFVRNNSDLQSPINIRLKTIIHQSAVIDIEDRGKPQVRARFVNDGRVPKIAFENSGRILRAQPFYPREKYELIYAALHFGEREGVGSEHTVNNQYFSAEIQFFHVNQKYANAEEASGRKDGNLVISVFVQEKDTQVNHVVQRILSSFSKITLPVNFIQEMISIRDFLPASMLKKFVYYRGSLTTPPCTKDVTWILLSKPFIVSFAQMAVLRTLYTDPTATETIAQYGNSRPLQPINDRTIYSNFPLFESIDTLVF